MTAHSAFEEMDALMESSRHSWAYKRERAWLWITALIGGVFHRPWDCGLGNCYNWCYFGREETACRSDACGPMPMRQFVKALCAAQKEATDE